MIRLPAHPQNQHANTSPTAAANSPILAFMFSSIPLSAPSLFFGPVFVPPLENASTDFPTRTTDGNAPIRKGTPRLDKESASLKSEQAVAFEAHVQ
jgi:hypothetical protein